MKNILYIVSTPIGNLEDITFRAVRILKEVDFIAAEDTRHTRKLLTYYGISKPLISYWGAREKMKSEEALKKLKSGQKGALVTDAGTPGISDPGEILVGQALLEGIQIVPIPGPSALITALSVSGISTKRFVFIGFLPPKTSKRINELERLSQEEKTLVFYESPHRLLDFLNDLHSVFGERFIVLCHELTKIHEEMIRGNISGVIETLRDRKIAGEYVIVVEGAEEKTYPFEEALREVHELIKGGKSRKSAVTEVASVTGLSKKSLYRGSLQEEI